MHFQNLCSILFMPSFCNGILRMPFFSDS
ncbi:hypothetical protein Gotur_034326 [Gossypium turneri]